MSDKPAIDLTPLSERLEKAEVYDEFCALMFDEELHYKELLEKLEEWGISSSGGSLSRFNASHRGPWSMERAKRQERAFLENQGMDLDEETRKVVAFRIFMDAASPNTSTKDVLRMAELEVQKAKLQQDAVKLKQAQTKLEQQQQLIDIQTRKIEALEEQKRAAADVLNNEKTKGGMSPETIATIRAALGMS